MECMRSAEDAAEHSFSFQPGNHGESAELGYAHNIGIAGHDRDLSALPRGTCIPLRPQQIWDMCARCKGGISIVAERVQQDVDGDSVTGR